MVSPQRMIDPSDGRTIDEITNWVGTLTCDEQDAGFFWGESEEPGGGNLCLMFADTLSGFARQRQHQYCRRRVGLSRGFRGQALCSGAPDFLF